MRFLFITLLLLLAAGQARAQYFLYEPDRQAMIALSRLGFIDSAAYIPAQGATLSVLGVTDTLNNSGTAWYNPQGTFELRIRDITLASDTLVTYDSLDINDFANQVLLPDALQYMWFLYLDNNDIYGDCSAFATKSLPRIREIRLSENRLTDITGLLQACSDTSLRQVIVHTNRLTTIPQRLLNDFHKLEDIDLSYNPIAQLPPPQFTCTVTEPSIGLDVTCPCYGGLDTIKYIKLASSAFYNARLSGQFHPEHFLAKSMQKKASDGQPLPLVELNISGQNFVDVSPFFWVRYLARPTL